MQINRELNQNTIQLDQQLGQIEVNLMEQETTKLKTKSYLLTIMLEEVAILYPDLAESYLALKENHSLSTKNFGENSLKPLLMNQFHAELLFLYRQKSDQSIGYKIIKHQRLMKMLAKLTKKLPAFDRIQEVLIMQDHQNKNKKTSNSKQFSNHNHQLKLFYAQKTQTILQKMVNQYSDVVALLKISPSNISTFTLTQFVKFASQILKDKYKKLSYTQQSPNFKNDFKSDIVNIISFISEKVTSQLTQIFITLIKQGEEDQMMASFLTGRHKFFRIQAFDYNKYQNQRNSKFWNMWEELLNEATRVLFEFKFQTSKIQEKSQEQSFQESMLEDFEVKFGWRWGEIEKVVNYLQALCCHIIGKMGSQTKFQATESYQERIGQFSKAFCQFMSKQMVLGFYQNLKEFLKTQDWTEIETSVGMEANQIMMHQKKKDHKLSRQSRLIVSEERYSDSGEDSEGREQMSSREFSEINMSIFEERFDETRLNKVDSRDLLSQFYYHQLSTLYAFIECEKRWFFRNYKGKDINVKERYNTALKWITLSKDIIAENFSEVTSGDGSTFMAYVGSLVYSFFDLKETPKLKSLLKSKNQQNIMVEEDTSEVNEVFVPQRCFLYNDVENIVTYQNISFENISQCHYYLKNIKNDTRAQFDDRSWTEYLKNQLIRLFIKGKNDPKSSKKIADPVKILEGLNLIKIPVRGRYCQHLDFFDLSEVYNQIFPEPFCSPEEIPCPKCFVEIPFDELIYLKEVEIIIEMIKQFYIEGQGMNRLVEESFKKTKVKWEKIEKAQVVEIQQKKEFVLQDLRLIMNHQTQGVKLKGKYFVRTIKNQSSSMKNQIEIQNEQNLGEEMEFEQALNKEIYETFLNPNKKFRSVKKLNKFLKNFGRPSYKQQEQMEMDENLLSEGECLLGFDQKIENARQSLDVREKLYRDLEKGTISV